MLRLEAFPGWRYSDKIENLSAVVAPPYDVISDAERNNLYEQSPYNIVRLILNRPSAHDTPGSDVYSRAAVHLACWREDHILTQDDNSVYIYEQEFTLNDQSHKRRGFFVKTLLVPWGDGIYPHEKTLAGPKVDRLNLMRTTRANLEPVFGLLRDSASEIQKEILVLISQRPADSEFTDEDKIINRLWRIDAVTATKLMELSNASQITIADGHHRYETAIAYRDEIRRAMESDSGAGHHPKFGDLDCDWIMMYCSSEADDGLVILPTHRMVHSLPTFQPSAFLASCCRHFIVTPADSLADLQELIAAASRPAFGLVFADRSCFALELRHPELMDARAPGECQAWRQLDVSVLHLMVLEDLLGIDQEKLLQRINLRYTYVAEDAYTAACSGSDDTQFSVILRSTRMEQIRDVSENAATMPQKSTYFWPKPRSGMVLRLFA